MSKPLIGQSVFIVILRDRRSDLGVSVHLTREGADAAIEQFKAIYDNLKPSDWKEESWGQPRWCRYVRAHDEGPSAYIELGEIHA